MPLLGLCHEWLQRAPTETHWCCCASMGFVLEGIVDSFANACYTLSSIERDSQQTSLSRSRHWMKRWTTVLSVLAQADWQFWNVSLVQSLFSLSLLLRGKNFLWLYWTGWEICTAPHDAHDDHGWVGIWGIHVDAWQCWVTLSLSHTSSAISTTRIWRDEELKQLCDVSQSIRNESLLYLISRDKTICSILYAFFRHDMHHKMCEKVTCIYAEPICISVLLHIISKKCIL